MPRKTKQPKSLPPEPTRPAWRPTDYRVEYCEEVVKAGDEGYSLTAFAGKIGVARSTIIGWAQRFPEFAIACDVAKAKRAQWWEARLREVGARGGNPGQSPVVIFGVKNTAPEDWRDSTQIDHTSSDGSMTPKRVLLVAGEEQDAE